VESSKATAADRSRLEALEEEVRDMQLEVQVSHQLNSATVILCLAHYIIPIMLLYVDIFSVARNSSRYDE
jgi:hypothetical protein